MKVWIVGYIGPETNHITNICKNEETARLRWDEARLNLIDEAEEMLEYCKKESPYMKKIYEECIQRLQETDPDKIDNYPHETPHIQQWTVEDEQEG